MEKKPKCEKRWRSAAHKECQVVRSNKKFRKDIVQYDLQILIHKYTNSEKLLRDVAQKKNGKIWEFFPSRGPPPPCLGIFSRFYRLFLGGLPW